MSNASELALSGLFPTIPTAAPWRPVLDGPLPAGFLAADRYRIAGSLAIDRELEIYQAIDEASGTTVKLKRLPPNGDRIRAEEEMEVLASLDHPRIAKAIDTFSEDGHQCFVQSYLPGPTLRQLLRERGPLPFSEVPGLMRSVLEVLSYMHGRKPPVLHRDVKPANMVLLDSGEVALIDFDLAAEGPRERKKQGLDDLTTAYTAGYAPPEQSIGLEAYPASDLYALAASVLYLTTGRHPILHWNARRGRILVPKKCPGELAELLIWMLEPALDNRCPDAPSALERLKAIS